MALYAIDRKGHCLWHFNLDNRLDNNTVLGLFCDKDNNVWAALDDGIAYIHHNSPVMLLTPANHETKLGMVYDIAHRGDCFYLATNQGLYEYHQVTENLRLLPHTEGQNWYVKDIDGQLFAGNNAHTLLIGRKRECFRHKQYQQQYVSDKVHPLWRRDTVGIILRQFAYL